jgi:hypothetical protein
MEIKIPYCLQEVLLSLVSNLFTTVKNTHKWRVLKISGPMRDNMKKEWRKYVRRGLIICTISLA